MAAKKFINRNLTRGAVVTLQRVATPPTTYEGRADPVKYRAKRYEPVPSPCQQVPDVWDRAQTRQMMDHVVGDSDYVPKVNETLPTGFVQTNFSGGRYFTIIFHVRNPIYSTSNIVTYSCVGLITVGLSTGKRKAIFIASVYVLLSAIVAFYQ